MTGISLRFRFVLIACLALVALGMAGLAILQLRAQGDGYREAAAHDQSDTMVLALLRKVSEGGLATSGPVEDPSPETQATLRGFAASVVAPVSGASGGYCTSDGDVIVAETALHVNKPGPDTGHHALDIEPHSVLGPPSKVKLLPADRKAVAAGCQASRSGETTHLRVPLPRDLLMIAVRRATNPRFAAWAIVRLPPEHAEGSDRWRMEIAITGVITSLLVLLAADALFALRRGAGDLQVALQRLERDLRSDIPQPRIGELAQIAEGLRTMASHLADAHERERALERRLEHEQRLVGLGRVVAGVAHEVRNPLTGIKLMLDGMARRRMDDRSTRDVATCLEEIARLDHVVGSLLLVSRKEPAEKAALDLAALVDERLESAEALARTRGVRLVRDGGAVGLGNRSTLTRVLDNLLRNAIEASPEGAEVRVTLERTADETRISVVDRGDGVPAARVSELFEPFFTLKPDGTGLGLFLSRSVMEAHGGRLIYDRGDGVTRFILTLPLDTPHAESTANPRR
jgi:signal transduction histidine kinase